MGLVDKLKLSDKEIAIGLEQRSRKHFILDNTTAEKVILENQNDDIFVEFGKIKN
mgnify:CR=1 FL=1